MEQAIKAYAGEGTSVMYEYPDGRIEQWVDGDRSWRNQNPCNVRYRPTNHWVGQIGYAAGMCCFNDPEMGVRATRHLLILYGTRGQTLEAGIHTYAPPQENDTDSYVDDVENTSKIPRTTLLKNLTPGQLESVIAAMKKHEGQKVGHIVVVKRPETATHHTTSSYVWHTQEDDVVRPSHKARDGVIFMWNNLPADGNPGEAYGCRCWAEAYLPGGRSLDEILKK